MGLRKCKILKNKKNNQRGEGFTLIELLTIILIMSLVISIVIVVSNNIINNTKEKTYKVTVNNIEKVASSYAIENYIKYEWIDNQTDNSKQFFCVSIEELIDAGFLRNDVLNSNISRNNKVNEKDYVYLERDKLSKSITKNLLLEYYDETYNNYCDDYKTGVDIEFFEEPMGWSREKKVTINYKIFNLKDNISEYKYKYNFNSVDIDWKSFNNLLETEKIENITSNGIVKAYVESTDLNISKEYKIDKIDRVSPKIELTLDGKGVEESKILGRSYAKGRDVLISLIDNESGLKKGNYIIKYEWSLKEKKCDELTNSVVINVDNNNLNKVSKNINITNNTGMGKLYVCGEDISDSVGNIKEKEIESIDLYLDNIKPVISIGNYSGNSVVSKVAVIPISVNDMDSGVKKDSFKKDDIIVLIDDKNITDGITLSLVSDNNYNLEIKNNYLNGKIVLKINKDNILDNALNGNDDVVLDTNVSFKNIYTISYDANGGSGAPENQYKKHDVTLILSTIVPVRLGFKFIGWSTDKTSVDNLYMSGSEFKLNETKILYAQWEVTHTLPIFTYTGSYQLVEDDDTIISSGINSKVIIPSKYQTYTGNWKIRFLTSGKLTFHELRSAANGIDAFLVGGGGNGGSSYAYGAGYYGYAGGGGGGGGGYRTTKKGISVSTTSYDITVGSAGEKSTGFNQTANGGKNGKKPTELNCCESRCAGKPGAGGSKGGLGQVNVCYIDEVEVLSGASGGLEFDDSIYTTRYGGGGGGGHGHNGGYNDGRGKVGYGGEGGIGGGGTGNRQYYGENTHNGKANTGGGGGGASYRLTKTSYSNYFGDIYSSAQSQLKGKSYSAGTGGSGIVIIRNKR